MDTSKLGGNGNSNLIRLHIKDLALNKHMSMKERKFVMPCFLPTFQFLRWDCIDFDLVLKLEVFAPFPFPV